MNTHELDTYIGFVIRCKLTIADIERAFALATTFTRDEQAYILRVLRQIWH